VWLCRYEKLEVNTVLVSHASKLYFGPQYFAGWAVSCLKNDFKSVSNLCERVQVSTSNAPRTPETVAEVRVTKYFTVFSFEVFAVSVGGLLHVVYFSFAPQLKSQGLMRKNECHKLGMRRRR